MDAVTNVPPPHNEPVRQYPPGSPDRAALESKVKELAGERAELTMTIGGRQRLAGGEPVDVVAPHNHRHVLGTMRNATGQDVAAAIDAAAAAAPAWRALAVRRPGRDHAQGRRPAERPWRATINAATILGQSKSVYQAEIDAACELIDFWRYNVHYARRLLAEQPESSPGSGTGWSTGRWRASCWPSPRSTSPRSRGTCRPRPRCSATSWCGSRPPTQQLAAHYTMRLLEAAGLPPGVINLVTGDGQAVSEVALPHRDLAGIHFTGSTATFQHLWRTVGENIAGYRGYPRLVGETGGKDFVIAHPSADPAVLATALVRGAYEYQGRSAPPRRALRAALAVAGHARRLPGAGGVAHHGRRRGRPVAVHGRGHRRAGVRQALPGAGGRQGQAVGAGAHRRAGRRLRGLFRPAHRAGVLRPGRRGVHHRVLRADPRVHVYDDARYDEMLAQAADVAPYALTGSIIAQDRAAIAAATDALRFSAGNFYINDKPTGAVVGQQPFGGARASGTNDKAGSIFNLIRWVNARAIKELFVPPVDYRYPHMGLSGLVAEGGQSGFGILAGRPAPDRATA
jgi:1-pyrroline-5-carboxylate dehydrogenase